MDAARNPLRDPSTYTAGDIVQAISEHVKDCIDHAYLSDAGIVALDGEHWAATDHGTNEIVVLDGEDMYHLGRPLSDGAGQTSLDGVGQRVDFLAVVGAFEGRHDDYCDEQQLALALDRGDWHAAAVHALAGSHVAQCLWDYGPRPRS